MTTIDGAADEVASKLIQDLGPYPNQPMQDRDYGVARSAAVFMAIRLNKSIDIDQLLDKTIAYQSRSVEISLAHNQVIILAGYAAFFTLWSTMATAIPLGAMLISGALMVISAAVFLAWTVCGMFVLRNTSEWQMQLFRGGPVDFVGRQVEVEKACVEARASLMRYWKPTIWSAGGTAGLAAAILVGASCFTFVEKVLEARAKTLAASTLPQSPNPSKAQCASQQKPQDQSAK